MRREPTAGEAVLWELLRDRRLGGFKFRRQHTIGRFVVDFYCAERNLVVEIDGRIHETTREQDAARESFLHGLGFTIIRFENRMVMEEAKQVLKAILKELRESKRRNL